MQRPQVVIVNYGMGNQRSVENAFLSLGCDVLLSANPEDFERADRIVLPGVGAFGEGIDRLRKLGLVEVLNSQVLEKKKPFLGICLGMQLLADEGYEFGKNQGLGWIPGKVIKMEVENLRIPHVGWNNLKWVNRPRLFTNNLEGADFYFVHSFHFVTQNPQHRTAVFEYGGEFAAVVNKDNIFGAQFHPEKSQKAGRCLLENFLAL